MCTVCAWAMCVVGILPAVRMSLITPLSPEVDSASYQAACGGGSWTLYKLCILHNKLMLE